MDLTGFYVIITTIITVLGSTGAWSYYKKKLDKKEKDENIVATNYKERIVKLEEKLEESSETKEELRKEILKLTAEVSRLRVKVEYLEKENQVLTLKNTLIKDGN